jgi:hypothetical protein
MTVMRPLQEKSLVELSMTWLFGFMPPDDTVAGAD